MGFQFLKTACGLSRKWYNSLVKLTAQLDLWARGGAWWPRALPWDPALLSVQVTHDWSAKKKQEGKEESRDNCARSLLLLCCASDLTWPGFGSKCISGDRTLEGHGYSWWCAEAQRYCHDFCWVLEANSVCHFVSLSTSVELPKRVTVETAVPWYPRCSLPPHCSVPLRDTSREGHSRWNCCPVIP